MSLWNLTKLATVEIAGDIFLKKYTSTNKLSYLFLGIGGYAAVVYYLIVCLRTASLLYINGMWDGISAIVESIAVMILLGEKFDNWIQYIGLILIISGLFLLKK